VNERQIRGTEIYNISQGLWDETWKDCNEMMNDIRGREIVKQLIRSAGSISANIEEGYGRGSGKEYTHFLRIATESARESKGWYLRSKHLLPELIIESRINTINGIIAMLNRSVLTLENKQA
jgi:four helix bundle protein